MRVSKSKSGLMMSLQGMPFQVEICQYEGGASFHHWCFEGTICKTTKERGCCGVRVLAELECLGAQSCLLGAWRVQSWVTGPGRVRAD